MKNYNDFLSFLSGKTSEITYDTVSALKDEWKPTLTLSQDDIILITKIAHLNCLAILRQYHDWLHQDPAEPLK